MITKFLLSFLLLSSSVFAEGWNLEESTFSRWDLTQSKSLTPKKVLLFSAEWCGPCKVLKESALPPLQLMGWNVVTESVTKPFSIRVVDIDKNPELWKQFGDEEGGLPQLVCIENDEVVRSLMSGCTTPMDEWGIGWLYKGYDERPTPKVEPATATTTNQYPLRGRWWSVAGNSNATRQFVLHHLLTGPKHTRLRSYSSKLRTMSREELQSLHSDDHEKRIDWKALESSDLQSAVSFKKIQRKTKLFCPT